VAGELMHIGKTEGLRGLYRGLGPAVLFQFSGNSMRFGVYHVGKQMAGVPEGAKLDSGTNFMFACLSGTLAGFVACPFFLLKTQFQVSANVLPSTLIIRDSGLPSTTNRFRVGGQDFNIPTPL
jgi:hypothetical protein